MGELSDAIWEFKEREHTFSVDKTGVLSYFDVIQASWHSLSGHAAWCFLPFHRYTKMK
ncbi:MAG: hypothetical protein PUC30_04760 [Lachnospiraceae bacterium]|nr:hypothetical protein [Lachnospiraceae bacterium]